ncbi:MAG: MFS transporter [Thermomicrobiales bacterium]
MRPILTNRSFVFLWFAGLAEQLTWWMLHTAILLLVFERTGSAFGTGLIPVFSSLPAILFGAVAGRIVDGFDRRQVMRWGSVAMLALLVVALPFAHATPAIGLYAFIVLQSAVMTVMSPAENALLPTLVDVEHLKTANALNVLNDGFGRILGPAVGAWLLVRSGPTSLVAISLVLTAVGWGLLTAMPPLAPRADRERVDLRATGPTGIVASLRDQGQLARRILIAGGPLATIIITFLLYMVGDVPFTAVIPAFFTDSLHTTTEEFGFMLSLRGVVGILGGVLIAAIARSPRVSSRGLLMAGLAGYGFAMAIQGVINDFQIGLWFLIVVGPAAAAIQTGMNTMLQEASPDDERGRVFALVGTLAGLVTITMSFSAGAIADVVGTRPVVIAAGMLQILPVLVLMRSRTPTMT